MTEPFPISISVAPDDVGKRVDQFLTAQLKETSRARVQQLIAERKVLVNDAAAKASLRLRGGERIVVLGAVELPPLRAMAEEIPLDIVYEDDDLAVINKAAGMMVHAGAGPTEEDRNRGTLVNALLHRFGKLSGLGGELRPGIVHRLDKNTSGLIVVAKNDEAHRRLAAQFARREVKKTYLALAHGWMKQERGTIRSSISRDRVRRTRMTTAGEGGREAITHYTVQRRIDSRMGKFRSAD
jgi:23S rRNA pseudouridine1911/1915/1917 synthase